MTLSAAPIHQQSEATLSAVGVEVLRGLTAQPKTLSPWLFYDAAGSRLFEAITELPEYYLTRTERSIFVMHADEIVAEAARGRTLEIIELGAGTATKTGVLLEAAIRNQGPVMYRAIDVSQTALAEAKTRLEAALPGLTVEPQVADYTDGLEEIAARDAAAEAADDRPRRLVLYIGSSVGNFAPEDAISVLRGVCAGLSPGDGLLLGVDMAKDERRMLAAYNDKAGVTAEFNMNALLRINRELGARFDPRLFQHRASWNPRRSRVEMHLESLCSQRIPIAALGLEVSFAAGETIHTENSYKFTDQSVRAMLDEAGFTVRRRWSDRQNWFGVYLATV